MKKTDAAKAPPAAFNPRAARVLEGYMDLPRMVSEGNLKALKAASMLNIDLSAPVQAKYSTMNKPYETQLLILAIQEDKKDVFDFLIANNRTSLNMVSNHLGGFQHFPRPERGTPLDIAYVLKTHDGAPENAAYYYAQLIANGARKTVGKHAAAIKKDLPKLKPAAGKPQHKLIGQALGRP